MTWPGIFIPSSQVEGFCYILLMSMYFKNPMYILKKKKTPETLEDRPARRSLRR